MNFTEFYITESCPLNLPYGGIKTGGGYSSNTEYELGAQIIAEALHCILGSLYKANGTDNIKIEEDHIREEYDKIRNALKEYRREVYVSDFRESKYRKKSEESIRNASEKLVIDAEKYKNELNKDSKYYNVAVICYDMLIRLGTNMTAFINKPIPMNSAFEDRELRIMLLRLDDSINKLFNVGLKENNDLRNYYSRIPDEGNYPAIRTHDGEIYVDTDYHNRSHVMFANVIGLDPDEIESGGWVVDGIYNGSHRSDIVNWAERMKAKRRIQQKRRIK